MAVRGSWSPVTVRKSTGPTVASRSPQARRNVCDNCAWGASCSARSKNVMTQWFVYGSEGSAVGPVHTDLLARGVIAGRVPRDAHVAAAGDSRWFPMLSVPEIADALRFVEA